MSTTLKRLCVATALALVASSTWLSADDLRIVVDPKADFSAFRTFAIGVTRTDSARPEIDNTLFEKKLTRTIRAALESRGLKHVQDRPDLVVDYAVTSEDVNTTQRGGGRGIGPQPLRFTVGTLVIDMRTPGAQAPVWRGVYRDDEKTGSKLVQKLPDDAKKLIAKYPKRSNQPRPTT